MEGQELVNKIYVHAIYISKFIFNELFPTISQNLL